jgi:hypothetical protein
VRTHILFVFALFATGLPAAAQTDIGSSGAGLRTTARLDRDRYEVGDVITLTVSVKNTTPRPFALYISSDETGHADGYRFEVRRDGGPPVPDPWADFAGSVLAGTTVLEPFATRTREFTLNEHVPVLKPGTYSVRMVSPAETEGLPFTIEATSPDALRKRVDALLEELRGGAVTRAVIPLLAYTGHSAAIPALVERLYVQDDAIEARVAHWLVLFDHEEVVRALRQALKERGPRYRMVYLLMVTLQSRPEDVVPLLLPWLSSPHDGTRLAAVEGLTLANSGKDPKLFAPLAALLRDPVPEVRGPATAAVAQYANEAAFKALRPLLVNPARPDSEQAVIGMGWIAATAKPGSPLRNEAVRLLEGIAEGGSALANQARYWLGRVATPP